MSAEKSKTHLKNRHFSQYHGKNCDNAGLNSCGNVGLDTGGLSFKLTYSPTQYNITRKPSYTALTCITETQNCTPPVNSHVFATILEDLIIQLRMLDECNTQIRNRKMQANMNDLRSVKYGVEHLENEDELFDLKPKNVESDNYKLCKHAADRNMCIAVITNTYLELVLNKTFETLSKHIELADDRVNHFIYLAEEEAKNKDKRRDLRRQVRQQKIRIRSVVYDSNLIVEDLVTKLEDASQMESTRHRYTEMWEQARAEQNDMQIQDKETKVTSTINNYRNKADDEQRVHTEIDNHIKITIGETMRQIEDCMAKYEKDIETMDVNITIMRVNYEKQLEMRLVMEQKFSEHGAEIEKWLQFKEDRENLRKYKRKMEMAAIILQAWWRGLLVRLELGPFKRILQKEAKKKKKKK